MLLFAFELKNTRMYNTTDVIPFHVQCFPFCNGLTSLRVGPGDGFRKGRWLGICRLNSCEQPTRGGPSVLGLGREKIIPNDTKYTNLHDVFYYLPGTK